MIVKRVFYYLIAVLFLKKSSLETDSNWFNWGDVLQSVYGPKLVVIKRLKEGTYRVAILPDTLKYWFN